MAKPLIAPAETVLTFLDSVGRRSEAEFYLRMFREFPVESFALLLIEASVLDQALNSIVAQLKFLRSLGLSAGIAVGIDAPERARSSAKILGKALEEGGETTSMHSANHGELHERVTRDLRAGVIPIVLLGPELGESTERFGRLASLAEALQSRKIVYLRLQGGLHSESLREADQSAGLGGTELHLAMNGSALSVINLRTDFDALNRGRWLENDDQDLLNHMAMMMSNVTNLRFVCSITSPLGMLQELFTVRGAGSLIKNGSDVLNYSNFDSIDETRLKTLMVTAFQKPLRDDFTWPSPAEIFLERNYRGAAIVQTGGKASFLSKFAVERQAQGEGMGRDIFHAICRNHPALYWRARVNNPITAWYRSLADGGHRVQDWMVFWRGISPSLIPELISDALDRPLDFKSSPGNS